MKYRIIEETYNTYQDSKRYYPQYRFLFVWRYFYGFRKSFYKEFFYTLENAQRFLDRQQCEKNKIITKKIIQYDAAEHISMV